MKKSSEMGGSEESGEKDEAKDIQEKMKKVGVKSSLPTSGVARVKQLQESNKFMNQPKSSSGSATGNPRNKTALAPGHSLMDWIRLTNSGVDLTGVGGVPQVVSLSELANHNKQNDAWIAIRGIVFNVTRYMDFHPGGTSELMRGVGKDATKLFENVHAWVNYQSILQKCVVGRLSRGSISGPSSSSPEDTTPGTTNCGSAALDLIKSCTKDKNSLEDMSDNGPAGSKMDWRQTLNSITLCYQTVNDYFGVYYQVRRINDSKLVFNLLFSSDIITHELELAAPVEWPPVCKRNFETTEVDFTFTKKTKELWKTLGSHTIFREPSENRIFYKEYTVVSNTQLSKLVHLLVLRAKDSLELMPIGRYVLAKMIVMGVEVTRSYTPVPPCLHPDDMAPCYTSDCVCLMIRRYQNGAMSPSITGLQVGQTLVLSSAIGAFVVKSFDRYSVIHMLAGGTGLTVMLGIIERALARRSVKTINLLIFNINKHNMFYEKQLEKVSTNTKLTVVHILSQRDSKWTGIHGILSKDLLKQLIGQPKPEACIFTCGSQGFIQRAKRSLRSIGWKPYQTYHFDD